MSSPPPKFVPERYRSYLLAIACECWDGDRALQTCCQPSDLVHDTLLGAITDLPKFRGKTPEEFRGWLGKILANTIKDRVRRQCGKKRDYRREQAIEALVDRSSASLAQFILRAASPSEEMELEEELLRMADALVRLPADQRKAITLHHLEGLTLAETAARMSRTKPSVVGLLRRGMAEIREMLEGRGE